MRGDREVVLVRHAKALSRSDWDGPDRQRPLSRKGQAQARGVADALSAGPPIGCVVSSPAVRCTETVRPLAEAAGTRLTEDAALGEASAVGTTDAGDPWVLAAWLAGSALGAIDRAAANVGPGVRVVAATHGDVLPALLACLAGRDGVRVPDVHTPKGGWWVLKIGGGCLYAATAFEPRTA